MLANTSPYFDDGLVTYLIFVSLSSIFLQCCIKSSFFCFSLSKSLSTVIRSLFCLYLFSSLAALIKIDKGKIREKVNNFKKHSYPIIVAMLESRVVASNNLVPADI